MNIAIKAETVPFANLDALLLRLRFVMKDADLFALQFRDQNHE